MTNRLLNDAAGLLALAVFVPYLVRLAAVSWRTHQWRVVALHVLWALWLVQTAWSAFAEQEAGAAELLAIGTAALWIWISHDTWRNGPPEHTTRPGPLTPAATTRREP